MRWESLESRRKKLRILMLVSLPSTPTTRMESSHYDLRDFNNQGIYVATLLQK